MPCSQAASGVLCSCTIVCACCQSPASSSSSARCNASEPSVVTSSPSSPGRPGLPDRRIIHEMGASRLGAMQRGAPEQPGRPGRLGGMGGPCQGPPFRLRLLAYRGPDAADVLVDV